LKCPFDRGSKWFAKEVYGAGVSPGHPMQSQSKRFEADPALKDFNTMMVKTHLT